MNGVNFYACYTWDAEWYLIEMGFDEMPDEDVFMDMVVPEPGIDESNWQCPYMEQYFSADGQTRLCEPYDRPDPPVSPCRLAFFLYRVEADTLQTPYGAFPLAPGVEVPARLRACVAFDDVD